MRGIAARVINFLKGLDFEGCRMTLAQALQSARCKGARSVLGAELLETLLRENRLYAATSRGVRPVTRSKAELFARIWEQLGWIGT